MSHPSRLQARGPAQRRRRDHQFEAIQPLEQRSLLAPFVTVSPETATFTAAATPTNTNLGTVTVAPTAATTATQFPTAAPTTSVSMLTPTSSFGGDIVRIKGGPGGVFGNGVYAISRGAGGNANAVNRPGVIYRVDPATGKASVFFDLNTVLSQLEPGGNAGNSVGASTGLVNWYDIAFDPEGYFDGRPSMFVSSVDRSDPNKNVIYQIGPDGTFYGAFVSMTDGLSSLKFTMQPSAVLVPPVQDQQFLRGLISGTGTAASSAQASSGGTTFAALYFDSNAYSPGQNISTDTLPPGVTQTGMTLGPQVGLTATNTDYVSPVYDAFTDFGTPAGGGIPARPGFSGVQGINGDVLIAPPATATGTTTTTATTTLPPDQTALVSTLFRRFEDIAFDQYGYFSQGFPVTFATTTTTGGTNSGLTTLGSPVSAGDLFVADLATGLTVSVTPVAPLPTTAITVPVQGSGTIGVTTDSQGNVVPIITNGNTTGGSNIGGRIVRITPQGVLTTFAEGFDTSGAMDSTSFINSSLSITFSADGTTLYASDNDAIWQFKTTTDLASSTSGSLIGLNDLRTLGVPYDGQGTAVAVVDTGVDASSPPFRGRVAPGTNVVTNGFGNQDTATITNSSGTGGTTGGTTTTGGGTGTGANGVTNTTDDGHGTLVAGVVAQFVPQATIDPVNVFYPFTSFSSTSTGTTGGATGGATGGGGATATTVSVASNALTTTDAVYQGTAYVAKHPFVNDPVRPGQVDRVTGAVYGFGTTETFSSEGTAFKRYPQIVIAFKNQMKKFRALGIAPVVAAGQFGAPFLAGSGLAGAGGTTGGTTGGTGTNSAGTIGTNNANNANDGDVNGMAFPAILNEAVSVTGTIPFPYVNGANTPPTDPTIGPFQTNLTFTPATIFEEGIVVGGFGINSVSGSTTSTSSGVITQLTAGNTGIFSDTVLASANRSATTDYAAPSIDVPTFRRRSTVTNTTTSTSTGTSTITSQGDSIDPNDHNTFIQGGTSLSAAIVGGSFDMVSSALNYWSQLSLTGVTSDAYLNMPVGTNTLNFGAHTLMNLTAYNNPDGINAILQWTSVPVTDSGNQLSSASPPYLIGTGQFRQYSRLDIGNAVAAIEGTEAINYLLEHNDFPLIDSNHNGIITAQEIQNFADNASKTGNAEAGAMAALLGGTARTPTVGQQPTLFGEHPDQPDVLQRRFNFFDYASDGQLNGGITLDQFKTLAKTLLPSPTAFVINNRARASADGYLIDPTAVRNYHDLQHLSPRFMWVPRAAYAKYRHVTPAMFKVNRIVPGVDSILSQFPVYTLFSGGRVTQSPTVQTLQPKTTQPQTQSATTLTQQGSGTTTVTTNPSGSNTGTSTQTGTSTNTGTSSSSGSTNLAGTMQTATDSGGNTTQSSQTNGQALLNDLAHLATGSTTGSSTSSGSSSSGSGTAAGSPSPAGTLTSLETLPPTTTSSTNTSTSTGTGTGTGTSQSSSSSNSSSTSGNSTTGSTTRRPRVTVQTNSQTTGFFNKMFSEIKNVFK